MRNDTSLAPSGKLGYRRRRDAFDPTELTQTITQSHLHHIRPTDDSSDGVFELVPNEWRPPSEGDNGLLVVKRPRRRSSWRMRDAEGVGGQMALERRCDTSQTQVDVDGSLGRRQETGRD